MTIKELKEKIRFLDNNMKVGGITNVKLKN